MERQHIDSIELFKIQQTSRRKKSSVIEKHLNQLDAEFSKKIEQWKSEHNAHIIKILKDIELTAEFYIGVKLFLM